jgi:hypothetical protein
VSGVTAKEQYKGKYVKNFIQYQLSLFSATNMTVGAANITIKHTDMPTMGTFQMKAPDIF